MRSPYEVLGIRPDASDAEIRSAYREALRRAEGGGAREPEEQENLRWAYDQLTDPEKRRLHDGEIGALVAAQVLPPHGVPIPAPLPAREPPPDEARAALEDGVPRAWRIAIDWIITIAGAVLIVLAVKGWVVNPYRIPSSSMEPTLHCAKPGGGCLGSYSDRVLANRFIYDLESPQRGQIVVFRTPPKAAVECGEGGTFVKRLIGLPGDTVSYNGGVLRVNGKVVSEPYIEKGRGGGTAGTWHVPKSKYFMMGDNRQSSCDSRRWGAVPFGNLIGPIFAIYWPPNRIWVATPGVTGGLILAALALVIVASFLFGARRRRRPARAASLTAGASLVFALLLEGLLLAALLAWGDHGTRNAATLVGIALGSALALWLFSLGVYRARPERPPDPE